MALMMRRLYSALLEAKVLDESARKAAEEVAGFDNRINGIESDLSLLKWIVGAHIGLTLLFMGGFFASMWRLVPLVR